MLATVATDISQALRVNPAALSAFQALAPSHKTEYLKWIDEAKREDTRARRIAGMIEKLTESPNGQA
jgi:uncharacterized protein YdeI (YjbR/CyaY-like superfamily)